METLILLTLIGILWLISPRRWRRRLLTPVGLVALLYLILTSPIGISLASQGLTATLPTDTGETAEAIVVVGRGGELRTRRAEITEDLWREKRAPKVFASGMMDAEFITEQLIQNGVPKTTIGGEKCSQNTEENALFTAAILGPQGVKKILLITDPFHMQRAFQQFRSVGFEVVPHASPLPPKLSPTEQILIMAREYVGLASYAVTGRSTARADANLNNPVPWVAQRIGLWNCKL